MWRGTVHFSSEILRLPKINRRHSWQTSQHQSKALLQHSITSHENSSLKIGIDALLHCYVVRKHKNFKTGTKKLSSDSLKKKITALPKEVRRRWRGIADLSWPCTRHLLLVSKLGTKVISFLGVLWKIGPWSAYHRSTRCLRHSGFSCVSAQNLNAEATLRHRNMPPTPL